MSLVIVTLQVKALPEQAPDQLTKRKPASGVAVNVTAVLDATLLVQVLPQSIPAAALLIEPLPPEVFAETLKA